MMKDAEYLLVIIGKKTHTSKWVTWEINRAKQSDVKLKLAAVKIDSGNVMPTGLVGASITNSFTLPNIEAALTRATNN